MPTIKNKSMAVFAVDKNIRGIVAVYNDTDSTDQGVFYKTFDDSLAVDDIIVVPTKTRLGYTTNKVVKVDVAPDFERTKEVKWVVGRVNMDMFDKNVAGEKSLIEKLNEGDLNRARDDVARQLRETMGEDFKQIEAISLNG